MNKLGRQGDGYTVVETLIVLAVTATMFLMAATMVSGQQRKAEFSNAVRTFESELQDIANDVSGGVFPLISNIRCTVAGNNPPVVTSGVIEQGTNAGCIYVGKVIHFAPDGQKGAYNVYSVAGRQFNATGQVVSSLDEARPQTIAASVSRPNVPDAFERKALGFGMSVGWVKSVSASHIGLGFFSTFPTFTNSRPDTGSFQVDVLPLNGVPLEGSGPYTTKSDAVDEINNFRSSSPKNLPDGLQICLNSAGSDQHAIITIGGQNRNFALSTIIDVGACS